MKKLSILTTIIVTLLAATACNADELPAGAKAPDFSLVNAVDGKTVTVKADDGDMKVIVFTCNQCPYAKAFEPRIIEIANKFKQMGVRFYAVDSNDDSRYPEETLENMKARADAKEYPFPYLKDGDSRIAKAYGARVTPHIFVVDGTGAVRYRGYVDDSAKADERKTTGLSDALAALTNGREVANQETRAFGCSIKFKG